jgi:hypothetical protein
MNGYVNYILYCSNILWIYNLITIVESGVKYHKPKPSNDYFYTIYNDKITSGWNLVESLYKGQGLQ